MNQSNVIFGALILAYLLFITIRGELPIYLGLLLANPTGGGTKTSASDGGTKISASDVGTAAEVAATLA